MISGFLITRLLHQEACRSGTIDILGFYARRVRRLLPALLVVLSVTLVAGAIFLTVVGEQQDLNRSAVSRDGVRFKHLFLAHADWIFRGAVRSDSASPHVDACGRRAVLHRMAAGDAGERHEL